MRRDLLFVLAFVGVLVLALGGVLVQLAKGERPMLLTRRRRPAPRFDGPLLAGA